MEFNSALFISVFLPLSALLYYAVPAKSRNLVLALAGTVFFAWGEPIFFCMLLVSIFVNYITGLSIEKSEGVRKKSVLIISIIYNVAVLVFFRYYDFIFSALRGFFNLFWNGFGDFVPDVDSLLPFGIAVFTLQAISYNVDIYRGEKPCESFVDAAVCMSFFPTVIAGPVMKYKDIAPVVAERKLSVNGISHGLFRFALGFVKVVLVASNMGTVAEYIFGLSKTLVSIQISWTGVICNALFILYELTGYADMAIGLGEMFGFSVPEDYNDPLTSKSISEFFTRRFRLNLSAWFKEYVYIPLGGNRKRGSNLESNFFSYLNMAITGILYLFWITTDGYTAVAGIFLIVVLIIEKIVSNHHALPRNKYETGMTKEEQYRAWLVYKYGKDRAVYMEKRRLFMNRHITPFISNIYVLLVLNLVNVFLGSGSLSRTWITLKAMLGFGYINTKTGIFEIFGTERFIIYIFAIIFALPYFPKLVELIKSKLSEKCPKLIPVISAFCTVCVIILTVWSVITLSAGIGGTFAYMR